MTDVIHPNTTLGAVHLSVAQLDRAVDWYQRVLGLKVHRREGDTAHLGAGRDDLLVLTKQPGARKYRGTTGLYHFAVLLPNRRELARAMARLFAWRHVNYPTDHVMTETTYLDDVEGNGIELYVDTPERGTWGVINGEFAVRDAQGVVRSGREPLDVEALLRELAPDDRLDEPMPEATKVGHVHLHVADLDAAVRFYRDVIGFEVQTQSASMRASFVSAGGYHHHLGLNTWAGQGAPPPPPDASGLRYFTVVLPDRSELEHVLRRVRQAGLTTESIGAGHLVRDPSRNGVLLTAQPPSSR